MAGWQPATEVEGLAPMLASLPPELPPELPPDQEPPQQTETFSWDRAEQLLPGMTAELNAFLESHFTRAREEAIRVLDDFLEKVLDNYRRGKTSPLAQIQAAYDGLLEYAQNKLREQMLSKARAAMRSRLASTQDTELIVAMHLLIDNCVDRFTCDLIQKCEIKIVLMNHALREADRLWRLKHPQRAHELPVFNEQIISLFSDYALAVLAVTLFAADENSNTDTSTQSQYEAGKRLYDTTWTQVMTKKITLEEWEKYWSEPTARLTGALLRYELGAWAAHRLTAVRAPRVGAPKVDSYRSLEDPAP